MTRRTATIATSVFDAIVCALVAWVSFTSASDPATRGLDEAEGYLVASLFFITGAPALALVYFGKAPKTALALALAFPAGFVILFIAAVILFAVWH
jgi:hypothetical protein